MSELGQRRAFMVNLSATSSTTPSILRDSISYSRSTFYLTDCTFWRHIWPRTSGATSNASIPQNMGGSVERLIPGPYTASDTTRDILLYSWSFPRAKMLVGEGGYCSFHLLTRTTSFIWLMASDVRIKRCQRQWQCQMPHRLLKS